MSWSIPTLEKIDEIVLSRERDYINSVAARMQSDGFYASEFRISALSVLHELWPTGEAQDLSAYIAKIRREIDAMSLDSLNKLSTDLRSISKLKHETHSAAYGAHNFIAGWLKTKSIELSAKGSTHRVATGLKTRHATFLTETLTVRRKLPWPSQSLRQRQAPDADRE